MELSKMQKISGIVLLILGILIVISFFITSVIIYICYKDAFVTVVISLFFLLLVQGVLFIIIGIRVAKKSKQPVTISEIFKELYNVDWYFDDATDVYCKKNNKKREELTNEDIEKLFEYISLDASYVVTWLIENDYYMLYNEEDRKYLDELKSRTITGYYLFREMFDYRIFSEDIKEDVRDFVNYYFENNMFDQFVEEILKKEKYCIKYSWEDYNKFKIFMDEQFEKYNENV